MYTVELAETRGPRSIVVVKHKQRRVCCASVDFIRWMHERVPSKQLRDEQKALVRWYEKAAEAGELIGHRMV